MKKKKQKKKVPRQTVKRTEVVVNVRASNLPVPTTTDLTEPIKDGKSLTIPKTWLSDKQILRLTERTPSSQIYKRPGKGGGNWDYVTVSYVQRVLDYAFGFNWDFEIVEHGKEADHVWVLGKLTVYSADGTRKIVKSQFGRSEVKHKRDSKEYVDYGNDLKAAASDALKKCASMLGIARDIYGKTDYKAETGVEPREPNGNTPKAEPVPVPHKEILVCHGFKKSGCQDGEEITPQQRDYSLKVYGRQMCSNCQKQSTPIKKN